MKKSLLVALSKYRPTEGKMPLENFLTEAFAWILENNTDFSIFFIEQIISKLGVESEYTVKNHSWSTQVNFDGKSPDMLCEINTRTGQVALVFEHKAWAELHNNQLLNYRNYANEYYSQAYIILISATISQHSQNPDLALCWSDIYAWIQDWVKENQESGFIFQDFLDFIKHNGMGPPAPISHHAIIAYYPASDLKPQISNLIKQVEHKDWASIVQMDDFGLYVEDRKGSLYGEAWGKVGLHFFYEWTPTIFVGFLLDGKDHCTKPLSSQSPDFVINLSFSKHLHNKYPHNTNYQQFIKSISKEVEQLNNQWDFYHHIEDKSAKCINKWHPVHIRKPMLEIFRGTETTEEQVEKFMQAAQEIIGLIVKCEHFKKLRDDFRPNP